MTLSLLTSTFIDKLFSYIPLHFIRTNKPNKVLHLFHADKLHGNWWTSISTFNGWYLLFSFHVNSIVIIQWLSDTIYSNRNLMCLIFQVSHLQETKDRGNNWHLPYKGISPDAPLSVRWRGFDQISLQGSFSNFEGYGVWVQF